MMNPNPVSELLKAAKESILRGDKDLALSLAAAVLEQDADNISALLIVAGLSEPQASLAYLNRVLELDPSNPVAREGLHWAAQKLREHATELWQPENITPAGPPLVDLAKLTRTRFSFGALLLLLVIGALMYGLFALEIIKPGTAMAQVQFGFTQNKTTTVPNLEPTQTSTATVKASLTPSPSASPSPTYTRTPTATATRVPTETATDIPKIQITPIAAVEEEPEPEAYTEVNEVAEGEKWIDIDLSRQLLFAYEGDTIVQSFSVSTGLPGTPTVTGRYYVYVKYYYDDMRGPGYDLPDVPYTMYFFEGYGIHGTYWHDNFGTPMSHGCVNMRTSEAGWLFEWAYVGILVNIHY